MTKTSDLEAAEELPPAYSESTPLLQQQQQLPQAVGGPELLQRVYSQNDILVASTSVPIGYQIETIDEQNWVIVPFMGPVSMFCPYERRMVDTVVGYKPGLFTLASRYFPWGY